MMKKRKRKMLRIKATICTTLATVIFFGLLGLGSYLNTEITAAILTGFVVLLLFTCWIIMVYLYFKSIF